VLEPRGAREEALVLDALTLVDSIRAMAHAWSCMHRSFSSTSFPNSTTA
jgi:hypothetical protein